MGLGDTRGLKPGEAAPWGSRTFKDVTGEEEQQHRAMMNDRAPLVVGLFLSMSMPPPPTVLLLLI